MKVRSNQSPTLLPTRLTVWDWQEVISGRWYGSDLLERWLNVVIATVLLCTAKVDLILTLMVLAVVYDCGYNQAVRKNGARIERRCRFNPYQSKVVGCSQIYFGWLGS